jgi:DNA-binding response OmpR family regulator
MRILLVEDEKQVADFLIMSLEAECFAVDHTADGEQGSFLARTNDYDLLILDNLLPGKSGREICADVRQMGKVVPILILSVQSDTTAKIELLDAGADDYLSKPFSLQELTARARALLRRPQQITDSKLNIDDLVMDPQKHRVTRGTREIPLTRKEFMFLEYLLKNKDIVLSRGMILEHVWDMTADPFSNTIEAHIRTLRKKIDAGEPLKLIHTIPGIGYKISLTP